MTALRRQYKSRDVPAELADTHADPLQRICETPVNTTQRVTRQKRSWNAASCTFKFRSTTKEKRRLPEGRRLDSQRMCSVTNPFFPRVRPKFRAKHYWS